MSRSNLVALADIHTIFGLSAVRVTRRLPRLDRDGVLCIAVDRSVAEALYAAAEQMLRDALDHGGTAEDVRTAREAVADADRFVAVAS